MAVNPPAGTPAAAPKLWWLAAAGLIAIAAVLAATAYGRGVLPAETHDPGALVRWGYGVVQTVHNISAASTIGALVFAAFIVPPSLSQRGRAKRSTPDTDTPAHPAFARVMVLASAASILWRFSAVAVIVFSFADIAGIPISGSPEFASQLASNITDLPTGTAWLWVVIISATVATATFGLRSPAGLAATAVLAMGGLLPDRPRRRRNRP